LSSDVEKKLDLKENEKKVVYVKDLEIITVKNVSDIEKLMNKGMTMRKTGATAMNDNSSRSHSIFTIYIETSEDVPDGKNGTAQRYRNGKLNLVDLAGSER
jgi:kinesin family protein 3/17